MNNTDLFAINRSLNESVTERSAIKLMLPDNLTRITVINDVRVVLEMKPVPHVIFFFHTNTNTSSIEQIYRCVYNQSNKSISSCGIVTNYQPNTNYVLESVFMTATPGVYDFIYIERFKQD